MATNPATSTEYIQHHLKHWRLNLQDFTWNNDNGGFWTAVDALLFSLTLGLIFLALFRLVAVRMTAGNQVNYRMLLRWYSCSCKSRCLITFTAGSLRWCVIIDHIHLGISHELYG